MPYEIISKKFRPQTFAHVVGQEAIVTTLKNALRSGKLAHAYLFCGCRGTGKTTFARILAKALNCAHPTPEMEPCNACPSCLDVNAGRSLDVLEIDGASNRGIDDIRNLNETVGYAPALGKFKIYIIDEVHMLTKEAFNALLKTLEEPPAHVKFFFATTEPHKVLPTIISRCQRFDLHRIAPHAMMQKLKSIAEELKVTCEPDVYEILSHLSEGSLRDAESLLDQLICSVEAPITAEKLTSVFGLMPRRNFFALDRAFETHQLAFAFELAQEVFASGKDLAYFLDLLIEHYRTLLHIKLSATSPLFDKERYAASALLYTEEQCLYILDYLIQWQQQLGKVPFKRIFLEMLLLHILRSKHRLSPATLVKRLIALEQQQPQQNVEPEPPSQPIAAEPEPIEQQAVAESEPAIVQEQVVIEEKKPDRNDLKDREFGKEAPLNFDAERVTIADGQGTSEDRNSEEKPTQLKTDSSNHFGTKAEAPQPIEQQAVAESEPAIVQEQPEEKKAEAPHPSRYTTLLQFAAIELEGTIKK